ncbi:MAG: two-component system, NarL family, sensor histidine kinase UhpB [Gaiellales bacterium]|jgi:signal transduction histidine kinase|nr:two-component system, NarL family, sensor histidine kinase UhpB [Gaiellales bacterium]
MTSDRREGEAAERARLIDHMLQTSDAEREALAHRLHDGPQQSLAAIRLIADGVRDALDTGDIPTAGQRLEKLEGIAAAAGDELRRMTGALYPVVMEQRGLLQALGSLAQSLEEDYETTVSVDLPNEWPTSDPERDRALYQVAREAATQLARDGAVQLRLSLTPYTDTLDLTVEARGSTGLPELTGRLLHERAQQISGEVAVSSGDVTTVVLRAPVGG